MAEVTKEIISQGETLYQGKANKENPLGNSENMIFEMETETTPVILRVSEYFKEKCSHVDFEVNWLSYLSKTMSEVARPVPSNHQRLFEVISVDGKKYILTAFEKAPGKLVDTENPEEWNEELFEKLGEMMGRMHSLSKGYKPGKAFEGRHCWDRDLFFQREFDFNNDEKMNTVWENITNELGKLPKTEDSYGIIHNDLHQLNFFIDHHRITVFDFDNCLYSWYALDIAITLYQVASIAPYKDMEGKNQLAEEFIIPFLNGYRRHNRLDKSWGDYIPLFLKYRRICSYRFVKHLIKKESNPRFEQYADWLRGEILEEKEYVSLDLGKIKSLMGER